MPSGRCVHFWAGLQDHIGLEDGYKAPISDRQGQVRCSPHLASWERFFARQDLGNDTLACRWIGELAQLILQPSSKRLILFRVDTLAPSTTGDVDVHAVTARRKAIGRGSAPVKHGGRLADPAQAKYPC